MRVKTILILFVLIISAGCKNRAVKIIPAEVIRVRTTVVPKEEISIPVHTAGILVSSEELKLSFKTGGIIAAIYVKEGSRVKKGEISLLRLTFQRSVRVLNRQKTVMKRQSGIIKELKIFTVTVLRHLNRSRMLRQL